ncbi:hypothetical protein [Salinicoccus albus]|uniref:arsenate reductase/protein-tyrosine-phosphatase family protein n=1 Tax=Salinicoccus albus TaxID=418756 RepID=UPI0003669553|nr:hypothetical protein [Salinicoccus albus]
MRKIFVCTGNTCRSPLAESYANTKYQNENFESRGLMVTSGATSCESIEIIKRESLLHPSAPEQLTEADTADSLILTMTAPHKQRIKAQYPSANVMLVSEFADGSKVSVPDPAGGSKAQYEDVFNQLKHYIDQFDS